MARSDRLLALLRALEGRRRPVTAKNLAQELGVSLRTIYRDVAALSELGAAIEGEAGLGYVLRGGFFLPPLMFTRDEIEVLKLGLGLVRRDADGDLGRAAGSALRKITAVLPPLLEQAASASPLLAGPANRASLPALPTVRKALREETKLRIRYLDAAGSETERVTWPVALGFFQHAEMLAAWCETRGGFRHFRLDRILSAESAGEHLPERRALLLARWRKEKKIGDLEEGS